MNICIIGDGLTRLSLATNLINKKINVHLYHKNKIKNLSSSRTIGISKDNFEFFRTEIHKIPKKFFWEIKKIEIYSEKLEKESLLRFEKDRTNLFYMQIIFYQKSFLQKKLIKIITTLHTQQF